MIRLICPTCRAQLGIAAIPEGGLVRCSACQTALRVAVPTPPAPPPVTATPPPVPEAAPATPPPVAKPVAARKAAEQQPASPSRQAPAGPRPAPAPEPANPFAFDEPANPFAFDDQPAPRRREPDEGDRPRRRPEREEAEIERPRRRREPDDAEDDRPRRRRPEPEQEREDRGPSRRGGTAALLPAMLWAGVGFGVLFILYAFDVLNHGSTRAKLPFGDNFLSDFFGDQMFSLKSARWEMVKGVAIAAEGVLVWLLLACTIGLAMRRPWGRGLALGAGLGGAVYFVLHTLILLFFFLPFLGLGSGRDSTIILSNAVWYLGMAVCFALLFLLVIGKSRREVIQLAEEDRDRLAARKRQPRLPLRGTILALGILVLLRSVSLGLGALAPLGSWLLSGSGSQRETLLSILNERMPGYTAVLVGHGVVEVLLAVVGVVLGVALICRWKLARWPAVLWGVAAVLAALIPAAYLLAMVPSDHEWWWAGNADYNLRGDALLGHPAAQMRWYAWGLAVSLALAIGLVRTMLHRRFNEAFPAPEAGRPEEEDDEG